MKKKICLAVLGYALVLGACGSQEAVSEAPVTDEAAAEASQEQETADAVEAETVTEELGTQEPDYLEDTALSTDLITMTIPEELKGKFLATIDGDMINVYDKASVDGGFPGLVFSVVTTADNGVYAGGMYTKIGEVVAADGTTYNVSRGYPSEIQWDYNLGDEMPEDYARLNDSVEGILEAMTGNGDSVYTYGAGTKGEELYADVVSKYVTAVEEGWDAVKLEEENMSPELYSLYASAGNKALKQYGYLYKDINHDGVDELLLGDIDGSSEPTIIYDIYTVVDKKPALVVSGSARDRYYVLGYGGIVNEFSGGAMESGVNIYDIEPNSTNLLHQYSVKYDGYADEKNPWFVSYGDDSWESMTEEDFNSRIDTVTSEYEKLELQPLSGFTAG